MSYQFKVWQELAWGVAITTAVFVLTAVATGGDIGAREFWITVGAGAARAAAGAALAGLAKLRPSDEGQ